MASITIRNLDEALKQRLRMRAAEHGSSMEEEARAILRTALNPPFQPIGSSIHERFAAVGGVDLEQLSRDTMRSPPAFE